MSATELLNLFNGLTIAYGRMNLSGNINNSGKQNAVHVIEKKPVTLKLWEEHLQGHSIGIIPIQDNGKTVVFGAIDVDSYIGFNIQELVNKIDKFELPLVTCRSKSGGAHLYCFMKEPVYAYILQKHLREWAGILGIAIDNKGNPIEIYPKQSELFIEKGDIGSFINMPYCNGDNTERYCISKTKNKLSLEEFIIYTKSRKIDLKILESISVYTSNEFEDGPPCLQDLIKNNIPEGTRNKVFYNLGVYYKNKNPDIYIDLLDKANHKYMDPPLPSNEVLATQKSVGRKNYMYTCTQSPLQEHCNKNMCMLRQYGIGSDIGFMPVLGSLTKLNVKPPIWFLDVNDSEDKPRRIELTTDELCSPQKFKKRCLEVLNIIPAVPKIAEWDKCLQKILEKVEMIIVPDDSSSEGQLVEHLYSFCKQQIRTNNKNELLSGKPWYNEEDDFIYFKMTNFSAYLDRHHFRDFKPNQIAAIFRKKQEENIMIHKAWNIQGTCVQTWGLKSILISKEIELDIPDNLLQGIVY